MAPQHVKTDELVNRKVLRSLSNVVRANFHVLANKARGFHV